MVTITLTDVEAQTLAELASRASNECYEIACGNWGTPTPEDEPVLYARSRDLHNLSVLLWPYSKHV